MPTHERFPTYDLDQADTTVQQDAAAARWCAAHGDDGLVHRMLGLDGAPLNPRREHGRPTTTADRGDVPADHTLLPAGWARDPVYRDRVHADVASHTANGSTVNDTARATGLSSRSVERLRATHARTRKQDHL